MASAMAILSAPQRNMSFQKAGVGVERGTPRTSTATLRVAVHPGLRRRLTQMGKSDAVRLHLGLPPARQALCRKSRRSAGQDQPASRWEHPKLLTTARHFHSGLFRGTRNSRTSLHPRTFTQTVATRLENQLDRKRQPKLARLIRRYSTLVRDAVPDAMRREMPLRGSGVFRYRRQPRSSSETGRAERRPELSSR